MITQRQDHGLIPSWCTDEKHTFKKYTRGQHTIRDALGLKSVHYMERYYLGS